MQRLKKASSINDMLLETVINALSGILKTEYKSEKDGESVDYEMTTRVIKSQARLVLDFIDKVKIERGEKKNGIFSKENSK